MGSVGGALGGGLDVQGLVQQILFVESAPIRRLETEKSGIENRISAYNSLTSKLTSLQSTIESLNSAENFGARLAKSSDEDSLTATATSDAAVGTYQIQVSRLALFDNFASDSSFITSDAAIGTGSFDLTVGTTTTTVTIDSTSNTLAGLKSAINNSGGDVNAAIVNDGSGFRLTITSDTSGSASAISISNNTLQLADSSPFTFSRTHNIASTSELDASLTVNGLSVTGGSNTVTDVIEGVTLNLAGTPSSTITLTVSNDTETVKTKIQEFVDAFNDAYSYINDQFSYNAAAETAGTLAGEGTLRRIQSSLARIVSRSVDGLTGSLNNFSSAGIELQNDGTLEVNSTKLDSNLSDNFADIQNLFIASGAATNSNVVFLGIGSTTEAGTYEVSITQLAEAATISSPNAIPGTLGTNETLTFTLGADTSIFNLTSTMTIDDIISGLTTQFATDSIALTASKDASDHLVITSNNKGSEVSFTVVSDVDGAGTGIGTSGMSDSGQDLDGTIKDVATSIVYAARGTGDDILVGEEGPVKDLQIQFLGSTTGTFGNLTLSLGYAEQLERQLKQTTDTLEGPLAEAVDGLEASIRRLDDNIRDLEDRLDLREKVLLQQFSRADQALQQLASARPEMCK